MRAAARVVVTATSEPFHRARHLAFAVVGLLYVPIVANLGAVFAWSGMQGPAAIAFGGMVQLFFAALIAWLALTVFDTRAGVTLWPVRWRDFGLDLAALTLLLLAAAVWTVSRDPAWFWQRFDGWLAVYLDGDRLRLGWALLTLAFPVAEEIVYRVLLLRGLEGYLRPVVANVVQAAVFELGHAYAYGYFTGMWFLYGLWFGLAFQRTRSLAFQRTRSLAAPVLVHTLHNAVFFSAVLAFNR